MQGRADYDAELYQDEELEEFDIRDYLDAEDLNHMIFVRALNYDLASDILEYEAAVGYDENWEYFDNVDANENLDDLYALVDEWLEDIANDDNDDEEYDEDEDIEWYDDDEDWGDDEEDEDEDEEDEDIIWE